MKNIFIDTDVVLDLLENRQPFNNNAEQLFYLIDDKKIKGYVSVLSFTNLFYVLRKNFGNQQAKDLLKNLKKLVTIINVDDQIIEEALHSSFTDFEDAVQFFTAASEKKVEAIITRNTRDFKKSTLPVLSPQEFLLTQNN